MLLRPLQRIALVHGKAMPSIIGEAARTKGVFRA
jgi:hypothetical protein